MTIKDQADQIVERYRPYAWHPSGLAATHFDVDSPEIETRNATLSAIKEVEARVNDLYKYCDYLDMTDGVFYSTESHKLTAILNELKSRV